MRSNVSSILPCLDVMVATQNVVAKGAAVVKNLNIDAERDTIVTKSMVGDACYGWPKRFTKKEVS